MSSPFLTHRAKVLGHYSTASWLRDVVMALYNGSMYKVGLSTLGSIDAEHYSAFAEMVAHYRTAGERDVAFHDLVHAIKQRLEEEEAARERAAELRSWMDDVRYELPKHVMARSEVDDHYEWFERRFEAGSSPGDAAAEFVALKRPPGGFA
jgi:hypothetical protein